MPKKIQKASKSIVADVFRDYGWVIGLHLYLYLQDCGAFCGNSILFGISPDWILDANQNLPWVNHWQKNAISIDWHRLTTIKPRITMHQPEWTNNCALAQPENPSTILKIKQKFTKVDPVTTRKRQFSRPPLCGQLWLQPFQGGFACCGRRSSW